MQIIIHRGTHQIGGVATEIRTSTTRILIDMGEELGNEDNFIPAPLSIPGVTDANGNCDALLFTHYHGDHIGQLKNVRKDIPIYLGEFSKDVLLFTLPQTDIELKTRLEQAKIFTPGVLFNVGDIRITPFSVDHSACDSYMFLIEADGKRILHTGDFRLHGFRGKAIPKILDRLVGKVDVLITEGTTLSRNDSKPMTEQELQHKAQEYLERYKYVFVLCATTNLERICALSKAVPRGKYFVCDAYQTGLLELMQRHRGGYSPLYRNIKRTTYGENLLPNLQSKGFLMMVRDNRKFKEIIRKFDKTQSIILYSMWDGYRTKPGSSVPDLLNLAGRWEPLHTSGHASVTDIQLVIEKANPDTIVPIHTDNPAALLTLCPERNVVLLQDGGVFEV